MIIKAVRGLEPFDWTVPAEVVNDQNIFTDEDLYAGDNTLDLSKEPTILKKREMRDILQMEDGSVYQGEWDIDSNQRDGRGVLIWPDGSRYEGHWKDDLMNGYGRLVKAQNTIYEGYWKGGKAHGKGYEWNRAKNNKYEGDFNQGVIEGQGKIVAERREYVGQWYKNKMHGHGTMIWKDQRKYTGQF